jgi:Bacterial protein of unknown function (DUF839)
MATRFGLLTLAIIISIVHSADVLVINGDNGNPKDRLPLGLCQGDCDNDIQCFGDLTCFMRTGNQPIPGCSGTGIYGKDYCYNPQVSNALTFLASKQKHSYMYPLGNCKGQCFTDMDCAKDLKCFLRRGYERIPGCIGDGVLGKGYCYSSPLNNTFKPLPSPTTAPTQVSTNGKVTYIPGLLNVLKSGLRLSAGLDVRIIAIKNRPVQYANGGQSSINFHQEPDAAAVFLKDNGSGNYYYVSNSETNRSAGVGSIEFDSQGNVLRYRRVLSGTVRNCGGGRSPFNTWLSGEENGKKGFVWEVSPDGSFVGRKTNLVPVGGNYESVAYYFDFVRGQNVYYVTEDSPTGPLVQFIPSENLGTREEMYSIGYHRYLRIDAGNSGTFSWVLDKREATPQHYPNSEGIDVKDGFLYFTSKVDKALFILNLSNGVFVRESTKYGAVRILTRRKLQSKFVTHVNGPLFSLIISLTR